MLPSLTDKQTDRQADKVTLAYVKEVIKEAKVDVSTYEAPITCGSVHIVKCTLLF